MRLLLVFILALSSSCVILAQGNLKDQLIYSNKIFNDGKYFDAITEFKRLQFFDKTNIYAQEANYKIALSYKYGAKYDDAVFYLNKALQYTGNNPASFDIFIEIVKVNILRGSLTDAQKLLDSKLSGKWTEEKRAELLYWKGWTLMYQSNWDEAANVFSELGISELNNLCMDVINKEYSVTFAKTISYFVPGAGQVYTGNYLSGAMSLAWNALWGYITIDAFLSDRIFDGIVVGNLLWFRFYRGNFQNAEKLAILENQEIYKDAKKYLLGKYKGKKP